MELFWNRKDYMKVMNVQKLSDSVHAPFFSFKALTKWAMPISTGIVSNGRTATVFTYIAVCTKFLSSTVHQSVKDFILMIS